MVNSTTCETKTRHATYCTTRYLKIRRASDKILLMIWCQINSNSYSYISHLINSSNEFSIFSLQGQLQAFNEYYVVFIKYYSKKKICVPHDMTKHTCMHVTVLAGNLHNLQNIQLTLDKMIYFCSDYISPYIKNSSILSFPIKKHNTLYVNVIMWFKGCHGNYYLMYTRVIVK